MCCKQLFHDFATGFQNDERVARANPGQVVLPDTAERFSPILVSLRAATIPRSGRGNAAKWGKSPKQP
jgi:hypothetical protein